MLLSLHFFTFCVNFLKTLAIHHVLKMIILRRKLMRFIIYVDNIQLYMHTLQANFVKLYNLYILNNILRKLWDSCSLQLTIFKERIHFCRCWSVYFLISHNPRKFQHRPILACLKQIVDKSLKSLRSENHTPRFHLFNRSIRPYIL